jgi:hypothetical protein
MENGIKEWQTDLFDERAPTQPRYRPSGEGYSFSRLCGASQPAFRRGA